MSLVLAPVPLLASIVVAAATPSALSPTALLNHFAAARERLGTYTCTWTVHEVKGERVQDRVYHVFFQKPFQTRAEVVAGDAAGSVAVWDGGDRVRGHQGGFLKLIELNLDIHNRLAVSLRVSLRGATIAQINVGWFLAHLQSIAPKDMEVTQQGPDTVLSATVHDPSPDEDVLREVYVFAPDWLPTKATEYATDGSVLKQAIFSDYGLNIALPASTWQV